MAQVDLDLGNYERFLDITLTKDNNLTTGKVYQVPALPALPAMHHGADDCPTVAPSPKEEPQLRR